MKIFYNKLNINLLNEKGFDKETIREKINGSSYLSITTNGIFRIRKGLFIATGDNHMTINLSLSELDALIKNEEKTMLLV